jgi:hypothetical protein
MKVTLSKCIFMQDQVTKFCCLNQNRPVFKVQVTLHGAEAERQIRAIHATTADLYPSNFFMPSRKQYASEYSSY